MTWTALPATPMTSEAAKKIAAVGAAKATARATTRAAIMARISRRFSRMSPSGTTSTSPMA